MASKGPWGGPSKSPFVVNIIICYNYNILMLPMGPVQAHGQHITFLICWRLVVDP